MEDYLLLANWKLNIKKLLILNQIHFLPKPKVDSSLLFSLQKKIF